MKVLVAGGPGLIGSAVIRHIIRNTADKVVCVDKLTYASNLELLGDVSGSTGYAFGPIEIFDCPEVERAFSLGPARRGDAPEGRIARRSRRYGAAAFIDTNPGGTCALVGAARLSTRTFRA